MYLYLDFRTNFLVNYLLMQVISEKLQNVSIKCDIKYECKTNRNNNNKRKITYR